MRLNYAMVFVSDMDRSVQFYRDVVGLPLKFQSPGWTEFVTDGATLALHSAEAERPAAETPRHPPAGICRPGFGVHNLDEFHQRMMSHGVACLQEPRSVFGARVAQYIDPDGLVLSVGDERPAT